MTDSSLPQPGLSPGHSLPPQSRGEGGDATFSKPGAAALIYPQPALTPAAELRRHPRYLVTLPVIAIPVLADGGPDTDRVLDGIAVDLSDSGIGFEVQGTPPPIKTFVIGLEAADGTINFCTASVRHSRREGIGVRIGTQFYPPELDFLRAERITPVFSPKTFTFVTELSDDALVRWSLLGVMRPVVLDWVQVCFQCQALLTFRNGCPHCGSARVATQRLIHHFACAHVGFTLDFEVHGQLQCPKCRTKDLVVGTDFEYLDGPYRCLDCQWCGTELERIAQCLRCRVRFPAHRALEKELIGYHVHRLDPMDFLSGS